VINSVSTTGVADSVLRNQNLYSSRIIPSHLLDVVTRVQELIDVDGWDLGEAKTLAGVIE